MTLAPTISPGTWERHSDYVLTEEERYAVHKVYRAHLRSNLADRRIGVDEAYDLAYSAALDELADVQHQIWLMVG